MLNIGMNRINWALKYFPEISEKAVLDVGCGDAVHLYKMGKGSTGIDGRMLNIKDGYNFLQWNFEEDILKLLEKNNLGKFDLIWSNSVIEHVLSPHLYILNMRRALNDNGILFVGVPVVNFIGENKLFSKQIFYNLFHGFLSQDHVNFFTYKILKYTLEFAGFDIVGKYSPFISTKNSIYFGVEPFIMLACRKIPNFQYGEKAYKILKDGELVWKNINNTLTKEIPK
jgi:SAM-dependent methyltransferase